MIVDKAAKTFQHSKLFFLKIFSNISNYLQAFNQASWVRQSAQPLSYPQVPSPQHPLKGSLVNPDLEVWRGRTPFKAPHCQMMNFWWVFKKVILLILISEKVFSALLHKYNEIWSRSDLMFVLFLTDKWTLMNLLHCPFILSCSLWTLSIMFKSIHFKF